MLFHVGSDPSNLFEDEKKTVADKYTQKVRHLLELKQYKFAFISDKRYRYCNDIIYNKEEEWIWHIYW